ncbi:MAG: hypothetical protein L0206_18175, partial [Actinobacteria bacterium]|nr:hypothetical protein [Actinomycetota bacterium]
AVWPKTSGPFSSHRDHRAKAAAERVFRDVSKLAEMRNRAAKRGRRGSNESGVLSVTSLVLGGL